MKLRIARKMDMGFHKRRKIDDRSLRKRGWLFVYNDKQLERAMWRLRRSWQTHCLRRPNDDGVGFVRALTPDFFAANRVESRLVRQQAVRQARINK